jgi:nicotinate-nucleotide adenylyltransferase
VGLAEYVVRRGLTDELWLMVSPQNPLKQSPGLMDENIRLSLAECAVADIDGVVVSDFEFSLPRPSYTYDTLQALKKAYPNCTFQLLIGADNWFCFDKWYRGADILQEHNLLVYPREGYPVDMQQLPNNVQFIDAPLFPWSSTQIREALLKNLDVSEILPKELNNEEIISQVKRMIQI